MEQEDGIHLLPRERPDYFAIWSFHNTSNPSLSSFPIPFFLFPFWTHESLGRQRENAVISRNITFSTPHVVVR